MYSKVPLTWEEKCALQDRIDSLEDAELETVTVEGKVSFHKRPLPTLLNTRIVPENRPRNFSTPPGSFSLLIVAGSSLWAATPKSAKEKETSNST
jgi:hypothetical protein